jgi:hypothetical protein
MTKIIVAFRNFANTPKMIDILEESSLIQDNGGTQVKHQG